MTRRPMTTARQAQMYERRADLVAAAWAMRRDGASLFCIAQALRVSKDWLREYAGMTDR